MRVQRYPSPPAYLRTQRKASKHPDAPPPPPPSPKQGAGSAAPAGGTGGVPLLPKTLEGGAGGITAHAKPDPPLKEGAGHNKAPLPKRGAGGAGGAAPAGGTGGVPLSWKTSEGGAGGIAAHAKPDPPLMEGARQDKTIRPRRRADAGVRGSRQPPIAKYEQLCYSIPMK